MTGDVQWRKKKKICWNSRRLLWPIWQIHFGRRQFAHIPDLNSKILRNRSEDCCTPGPPPSLCPDTNPTLFNRGFFSCPAVKGFIWGCSLNMKWLLWHKVKHDYLYIWLTGFFFNKYLFYISFVLFFLWTNWLVFICSVANLVHWMWIAFSLVTY